MKIAMWAIFGVCSVFLLAASTIDVVRVWSIFLRNPYGFSYLIPGDASSPGVPYFALAVRAVVPLVVSIGSVALTARRFLGATKSRA